MAFAWKTVVVNQIHAVSLRRDAGDESEMYYRCCDVPERAR